MNLIRELPMRNVLVRSGCYYHVRVVMPYLEDEEFFETCAKLFEETMLFFGVGTDSKEESALKNYYGFITFQQPVCLKSLARAYPKIVFQPSECNYAAVLERLAGMRSSYTSTSDIVPAIECRDGKCFSFAK